MKKRDSLILGAHMSSAGGADKAVERASEVTARCCQLFMTPPQQWPQSKLAGAVIKQRGRWRAGGAAREIAAALREAKQHSGIEHVIAHSSYLINLASPDEQLWMQSTEAFVFELLWAHELEIPYVVLHPGAFTTSSEAAGLRRVIRALNEVHRQARDVSTICLLENTAGQGTCLGCKFEHLATILEGVKQPDRLAICFDTCHAFAAGYPLQARADYLQTMRRLDQLVGLQRLKAVHLNDSKRELGSRVDRHEHIGQGALGFEPFEHLLNDRRVRHIPMYLETPKGEDPDSQEPWDVVNLRRLRELVKRRGKQPPGPAGRRRP